MPAQNTLFRSIVLAGERPGGNAVSHAFDIPASVLVPVAGKPSLQRVVEALTASHHVQGGLICGPTADVLDHSEELQKILGSPGFQWLAPATGPAASALRALEELDHYPALLTAGDHALLTPEIVDDFCQQALALAGSSDCDFIVGFVPYSLVQASWPESKRTVLKFSDGCFCGSNLFTALNPNGMRALSFWRQAEADRKHPWRIARRFGAVTLLRYLFKKLSLDATLKTLSKAAGCRVGYVLLDHARAAIDVDSIEDQKLAEKILKLQEETV